MTGLFADVPAAGRAQRRRARATRACASSTPTPSSGSREAARPLRRGDRRLPRPEQLLARQALHRARSTACCAARLAPGGRGGGAEHLAAVRAPQSFWCIVRDAAQRAGFDVRPYHAYVPSFGEWGFVLAAQRRRATPPRAVPAGPALPHRRGHAARSSLFPPDMARGAGRGQPPRQPGARALLRRRVAADRELDARRSRAAQLLAGGALLAGGGCGALAARRRIEGGFVGAGAALGHLLREPGRLPPPTDARAGRGRDRRRRRRGAVGGLAPRARRRAATSSCSSSRTRRAATRAPASPRSPRYPWGAHYLPLPGPARARRARRCSRELGVIESVRPRGPRRSTTSGTSVTRPQERLFVHGRWHEGALPRRRRDRRRTARSTRRSWPRWSGIAAGAMAPAAAAFAVPRAAGAPGAFADLDRVSMADFLARARLHLGAAALVGRVRLPRRLRHRPGRHVGVGRRALLRVARSGPGVRRRRADVAGGQRLAHAPARRAGGRPAAAGPPRRQRRARRRPGRRRRLRCRAPTRTDRLLAREVVLACPVFVAARLYRPWRERPPAFVRAFRYAPWLVANLHLDRRPADAPGAAAGVGQRDPRQRRARLRDRHAPVAAHPRRPHGADLLPIVRARRPRRRAARPAGGVVDLAARRGPARPRSPASRPRARGAAARRHALRPRDGAARGGFRPAARRSPRPEPRSPAPCTWPTPTSPGCSLFEEAFDWGSRAAGRVLARLGV